MFQKPQRLNFAFICRICIARIVSTRIPRIANAVQQRNRAGGRFGPSEVGSKVRFTDSAQTSFNLSRSKVPGCSSRRNGSDFGLRKVLVTYPARRWRLESPLKSPRIIIIIIPIPIPRESDQRVVFLVSGRSRTRRRNLADSPSRTRVRVVSKKCRIRKLKVVDLSLRATRERSLGVEISVIRSAPGLLSPLHAPPLFAFLLCRYARTHTTRGPHIECRATFDGSAFPPRDAKTIAPRIPVE